MGDIIAGPWKQDHNTEHPQPAQLQYFEMVLTNLAGHLTNLIKVTHELDARIQALEHTNTQQ